jgi:hypothetical protein
MSQCLGWALILGGGLFFAAVVFLTVASKLVPREEKNEALQFIQQDTYYCVLLPLLIPTTFMAVYCNWLSMKFFRHN